MGVKHQQLAPFQVIVTQDLNNPGNCSNLDINRSIFVVDENDLDGDESPLRSVAEP
jgi:hypothetical protein